MAWAEPQGGTVRAGSAFINQLGSQLTSVTQLTDKAILDWQSFGIGEGEMVRFLQPSQSSVLLNRVVGGDPSGIFGTLTANGQIFLVNPNGILFGKGANVNVGALVATTLSLGDEDFLSGHYRLVQDPSKALSFVVNQGTLAALPGGLLVLAAPLVSNEGTILAPAGNVQLAATSQATLLLDSQGLLTVLLPQGPVSPGPVVLTPEATSDLLKQAVNTQEIVEAGSVVVRDGKVILMGAEGLLVNGGTISATGSPGLGGGNVTLNSTGASVAAPGSAILASGVGSDSPGGQIRLLSERNTIFSPGSRLEAKAGETGSGGLVEVSGKQNVWAQGTVSTQGNGGPNGFFLLDPATLTIINGGGGDQDAALSVTGQILFLTPNTAANTVSELALESLASGSNILLQADGSITVNDIADNAITLTANSSITLQTKTGGITFLDPADSLTTSGTGKITINAGLNAVGGAGTANLGNLITAGGEMVVTAAGTTTIRTINAGAGNVNVTTISGPILDGNGALLNITGNHVTMKAASGIGTALDPIETAANALTVRTTNAGAPIFVNEADALTDLGVRTKNGEATINFGPQSLTLAMTGAGLALTASAVGTDVTVKNDTGGLLLNLVDAGAANTVTLEANGAITDNNGPANNINALTAHLTAVTGIGTSLDPIETSVAKLVLETTGAAAPIFVNELDALASLNVHTNNSDATVNFGLQSLTFVAGVLSASASGTDVTFQNTGGDVALDLITVGVGKDAKITASGAITDNNGISNNISGGHAILKAGSGIGTALDPIETNVATVRVETTNPGASAYVNEATGLTSMKVATNNGDAKINYSLGRNLTLTGGVLSASASGTDIMVNNTGGSLALNEVNVGGVDNVTLTATGAITDNNGPANNITANKATLTAGTGIGSQADPLETNLGKLNATTTSGGIFVNEADGLTLLTLSSGGSIGIQSIAGDLILGTTTEGSITAGGEIRLTALTGSILDGNGTSLNLVAPTATLKAASAIGSFTDPIETALQSLSTETTALGGITYVKEADSLSSLQASTNNGTVGIDFGSGSLTFQNQTLYVSAPGTDLLFRNAGGDLFLSLVDVGSKTATLTAGGSIRDGSGSVSLHADTANLTSGAGIGLSDHPLNTQVRLLNATAQDSIFIAEIDNLVIEEIRSVSRDVAVSSGGEVLVGLVTAAGSINLKAMGSILDNNGVANNLTAARDSKLVSQTGVIGTVSDPLDVLIQGELTVQAGGSLNQVSSDLAGSVLPSNTLSIPVKPPGKVIFNGAVLYDPAALNLNGVVMDPDSFFAALAQTNPDLVSRAYTELTFSASAEQTAESLVAALVLRIAEGFSASRQELGTVLQEAGPYHVLAKGILDRLFAGDTVELDALVSALDNPSSDPYDLEMMDEIRHAIALPSPSFTLRLLTAADEESREEATLLDLYQKP